MHFASSDFSPITCYMNSCDLLSPNLGWEEWMASTLHSRRFHSSSVTNQGILLIGGDDSPETSELLPWGTNQSIPSISLPPPGRSRHCLSAESGTFDRPMLERFELKLVDLNAFKDECTQQLSLRWA